MSNDLPYEFKVDSEILMYQDISQTCNLAPLDLGVRRLDFLGQPLRRLSQRLEAPQDRFTGLGVVKKIVVASNRIAVDAIDAL